MEQVQEQLHVEQRIPLAPYKVHRVSAERDKSERKRTPTYIVHHSYQCALIFCVVSESLGTSALDDYRHSQEKVHRLNPHVYVYNNDIIGAASYNIFVSDVVQICVTCSDHYAVWHFCCNHLWRCILL